MDNRSYTYPDDLLAGRNVLITGASDGIGRVLAVHAAAHGARVIIHGRNVAKLEKVYDEIESLPDAPRPSIAVMDLAAADSGAYASLADSLAEEFGCLDGLVNNAGILGERYSIEQYDAAMWQQVMHVNVTAAFAITQVCLPLLHRSEDASIIFTSSALPRPCPLRSERTTMANSAVSLSGSATANSVAVRIGLPVSTLNSCAASANRVS